MNDTTLGPRAVSPICEAIGPEPRFRFTFVGDHDWEFVASATASTELAAREKVLAAILDYGDGMTMALTQVEEV